jgi:hypothetical protein
MGRFTQAELDERAATMRRIGYPQHQIDEQTRLMRAGVYTPLDCLPMMDPAGARVVRMEPDGLSSDGERASITIGRT